MPERLLAAYRNPVIIAPAFCRAPRGRR